MSTSKDTPAMNMRHASLLCILLAAAAIIAAEAPRSATSQPDTPPPSEPVPAPAQATEPAPVPEPPPAEAATPAERAATPAPAPSPAPAPLPTLPQPEFVSPRQPIHGSMLRIPPAQRIAIQETGIPVVETDPAVVQAAVTLRGLTGRYIEDAPRIAELTIRTCDALRAKNQPASPMEMLNGALQWKNPWSRLGNLPLQYQRYTALYRKLRLEGGKSHAEAISMIYGTTPIAQ